MRPATKSHPLIPDHLHNDVVTGKFTKAEASIFLASGKAHLHSTQSSQRDSDAIATIEGVGNASIPTYSWEVLTPSVSTITESGTRRHFIENLLSGNPLLNRDLSERLDIILEELLTNALYHGYRNTKGEFKYRRTDTVNLSQDEAITVGLSATPHGVFLSVKDMGGNLRYENIRESFLRCYRDTGPQIQSKERGAGLGWYMVFESTTHLKVVVERGKSTEISLWIARKSYQRPNEFSFNFFLRSES